jgi:site-specific DNA recombinase
MKSYFAYIRVSTVKQGEHSSSLLEQKSAIEAYAGRHDLRIGAWFEETETAAKQGRREFNRLTGLLRKGKASGVIIHKIDRSARNLRDWARLGELIDAGIEVLFAHEGLDMQTRGGRLAADIQAVVAADFIRNLRDEVRKGFYGRLKQGFYPLRAPRGYLDRGKGRAKEICPVTGPLVRQAFELYGTGNYSLELLRHEMARRGLRGSGGKAMVFDAISVMLRNPFYVGLMRIRTTGEVFEGVHPPLVSKALFDRVQAIMDGRLYPRIEKHTFLFRRLVQCAQCGRSLSGERQKGHVYYRCHDRECPRISVTEERIDERVSADLQLLALDERDVGDFRDILREQIEIEDMERHDRHAHAERDLALLEQRIARLTDALIDGTIDKPTYEERKTDLYFKRRELRDRLESDDSETFWRSVAQKFERGLTAYIGYQTGNDHEKREMVKMVSSNVTIRDKNPVLSMYFPFEEIRDWAISQECAPHQGAVRTRSRDRRRERMRRFLASLAENARRIQAARNERSDSASFRRP